LPMCNEAPTYKQPLGDYREIFISYRHIHFHFKYCLSI
jgi:hypothetical protein